MFTNTVIITVFEKTVGADRLPAYIPHYYAPVYWEQTNAERMNKNANISNFAENDSIYCAIPAYSMSDYTPKRDDLIFRDFAETPDVSKCYTVISVTDCLYGSDDVKHLEVIAC